MSSAKNRAICRATGARERSAIRRSISDRTSAEARESDLAGIRPVDVYVDYERKIDVAAEREKLDKEIATAGKDHRQLRIAS